MKYKTFARVIVKLLGLYFTVLASVSALSNTLQFLRYFFNLFGTSASFPPGYSWSILIPIVLNILQMAIGLYLFLGGEWIVNKMIPSNRPYCHECGYDLTNNQSTQCPECGTPTPLPPRESSTYPPGEGAASPPPNVSSKEGT